MAASSDVVLNIAARTESAVKEIEKFTKQSTKSLGSIEKSVSLLNKSVASFAGNLAAGVVLKGIEALASGFKSLANVVVNDSIKASAQYQDSLNQLQVALELTGKASKESLDGFEAFAAQIQATTKFSDDAVLSSAALIQQLGNLDEKGLKRATQAALDLSVALGKDLSTTTELIAKAAAGNVGAFSRYGIQLQKGATDAQTFENALRKLEAQFGGAALRSVNTFSGALAQNRNAFDDVLKVIGNLIVRSPAVVGALKGINQVFVNISNALSRGLSGQDLFRGLINGALVFAEAINSFLIGPLIRFGEVANFVFQGVKNLLAQTLNAAAQFGLGFDSLFNSIGLQSDKTFEKAKALADGFAEAAEQADTDFANAFASIGESKFSENIEKQIEVIRTSVRETTQLATDQFNNLSRSVEQSIADISDKSIEIGLKIGDPDAIRVALEKQNEALLEAQAQLNFTQDELALAREQQQIEAINRITQVRLDAIAAETTAITSNQFLLLEQQRAYLAEQIKNEQLTEKQRAVIQKKITDNERQQLSLRLSTASTFFGDLSSLTQTKNKELFAIGKAAALTNAIIQGALAVQNALAVQPYPVGAALAVAAAAKAAVNVATISAQSLRTGTDFVTGGVPGRDSVPALLTPGERVLTVEQNKDLTRFLESDSSGSGNEDMVDLLGAILGRLSQLENTIVVNVGNKEIIREVREGLRAGRTLAV